MSQPRVGAEEPAALLRVESIAPGGIVETNREKVAGPRSNSWGRLGTLDRGMALHFSRVAPATEELEIWSASELGYSFVISNESRSGPGLHGQPGFVASWRPINFNRTAIRVGGSPFRTFAEAEKACEAMLVHLINSFGIFADENAAEAWFRENDPEGVAFEYEVLE